MANRPKSKLYPVKHMLMAVFAICALVSTPVVANDGLVPSSAGGDKPLPKDWNTESNSK